MKEGQTVDVTASLRTIDGIGEVSMEVLLRAGFENIEDLKKVVMGNAFRKLLMNSRKKTPTLGLNIGVLLFYRIRQVK